jgi:hypothetical protein
VATQPPINGLLNPKCRAAISQIVLKGDVRSLGTLFRLAEQTGQFAEEADKGPLIIHRVIYEAPPSATVSSFPAIRPLNRE